MKVITFGVSNSAGRKRGLSLNFSGPVSSFYGKADIRIIVLCAISIIPKWKYLRAGLMNGREVLVLRVE